VGTAHVSYQSAEEVKDIIQKIKPSTIVLELDAKRAEDFRKGLQMNPEVITWRIIPHTTYPSIFNIKLSNLWNQYFLIFS